MEKIKINKNINKTNKQTKITTFMKLIVRKAAISKYILFNIQSTNNIH